MEETEGHKTGRIIENPEEITEQLESILREEVSVEDLAEAITEMDARAHQPRLTLLEKTPKENPVDDPCSPNVIPFRRRP